MSVRFPRWRCSTDMSTRIPGVERHALTPHSDARGTLRELWRRSSQPIEVQQVLVTSSTAGTLRGMHYHLRQSDLCYVVRDAAIRWPIAAPTLSERDRTAGSLRDAIAAVRSHQGRYAGSAAP